MPHTFALLGPIGTWELIIIAAIALLIFGPRLPSVARSVGRSLVEFKKGLHEADDVAKDVENEVAKAGEKPESPRDSDQNLAG